MWIDSHCHLDAAEFDPDREAVAEAARVAGVSTIVIPAVERANFATVASVCREYRGCVPAYGIHPMYVDRAQESDLDALRDTLRREPAVAVGEIGLDYFVQPRDEAKQEFYFVEQLKIARELELPVILHVRRAIDAILKQLRRFAVPGGIAHAFNGSRQQADMFIRLGFKLGFGGSMTYPRALRIRELAATLPLDSLVLETDAPDIPPQWKVPPAASNGQGRASDNADCGRRVVGARNTPDQLPRIAATLAELRGIRLEAIAAATGANTRSALSTLGTAPTREQLFDVSR